ncbi:CD3324 family protein [Rossellomorea vietnamensis]|uniref:CD3324 family protein n=1 Tax=Rossellomorea vietnamensis TaxID=218284 RepID=UPI003CE9B272
MKYVKAKSVLPDELIDELQKYIQGEMIYIPKKKGNYQKWGARSGGRKLLDERNADIKNDFVSGKSISHLSGEYCLSIETVKKIVYKK